MSPEASGGRIAELEQALAEARSQIAVLEREQADLQALFDRAPAAVFLRDHAGRLAFVNSEYEHRYNPDREKVRGKTVDEVFPSEQAEAYSRHDRQVIEQGGLVEEEIEVEVDGEPRVYASMKFPIWREGETRPSIGGIEYDITESRRSREALKASEMRYRHLVEGLKNDVFFTTFDIDGDITYVSPSIENVLGYSPDECKAHWTNFVTDTTSIETIERVVALITSGQTPEPYEVVANHRDGSTRVLVVNEALVKDEQGRVIGSEGIYHDITQRKQAEKAARESENKLLMILSAGPIAVGAIWGDGSGERFANDRFREMFRVGERNLESVDWTQCYVRQEDREALYARFERDGEVRDAVCEMRRLDGTAFWALMTFVQIDYGDKPVRLSWYYDITEQKLAEAALRESEERLFSMLESCPMGIRITREADDRIMFVNRRYAELIGEDKDALIGRHVAAAYADPSIREPMLARYREQGAIVDEEVSYRRANGSVFDALLNFAPFKFGGEAARLNWIYDITPRLRAERELRESQELLRTMIDNIPALVFLRDRDGRFLMVNKRYEAVCQVRDEEIRGRTLFESHAREDAERFRDEDRMVIERGENLEREFDIEIEGEPHTLASIRFPVRGTDGEIVSVGGIQLDITERKQAEAALERERNLAATAEATLRDAIENVSEGFVLYDSDDRLVLCNNQYKRMFPFVADKMEVGTSFEEIFATSVARGQHFADEELETYKERRLREHRQPGRSAFLQHLEDGRWIMTRERLTESGSLVGIHADITELKRAEKELRNSEQRLKAILDSSPTGVVITNLRTQEFLFGNERFREMFGLGDRPLDSLKWAQSYVDLDERVALMARFQRDGVVRDVEGERRRVDGTTFWALATLLKMDYEGEPARLSWYYDITERKQAEEALRVSEERYALAMEGANEGLWDWDAEKNEMYVSPRFMTLVGLSPDRLKMARDEWLEHVHPDDIELYHKNLKAHLRGETEYLNSEFRVETSKGVHRWVRVHGLGVRDETGRVHRMIGSLGDVTERKNAEEAMLAAKDEAEQALADLKHAQDQLVQAEKMASLGQLTAGIAHEIKNPLNFINNFAETSVELIEELSEALGESLDSLEAEAKDDAVDLLETLSDDLKTIARHGQRADHIVKSMLLHARGELSDRMTVSLNELVDEAMKLAYHGERARDKSFQVTLEPKFDETVGEVELVPQEITRVLVNLFTNAFYAVRSRARETENRDYAATVTASTRNLADSVEIRVRDNGCGMPKEVKEHIFDPFFTTKPTGEGTGLGLSMSFDIVVQQHGGKIEVQSEPDAFTEIVIALPRRASDDRAAPAGEVSP